MCNCYIVWFIASLLVLNNNVPRVDCLRVIVEELSNLALAASNNESLPESGDFNERIWRIKFPKWSNSDESSGDEIQELFKSLSGYMRPQIVDDADLSADTNDVVEVATTEQTPTPVETPKPPKRNGKPQCREESQDPPIDPWSVIWYVGSFGGLVAFFIVVSCSEWCCRGRRPVYSRSVSGTNQQRRGITPPNDSPPPAYHLFAPPPYNSILVADKPQPTVFVINVPEEVVVQQQPEVS